MTLKTERPASWQGHRAAYRNDAARIPLQDVLAQAKDRLRINDLAGMLYPNWRPGKTCRSPFREDRKPSFSVFDEGRAWRDFGTGEHGDAVDFLGRARGLSNAAAVQEFLRLADVGPCSEGLPGTIIPQENDRIEAAPKGDEHRKPVLPDDLRPGRHAELRLLASLRCLNVEALTLASGRGLLHFGTMQDGDSAFTAWIITDQDRRNAQARRLDGLPWQSLAGAAARRPSTLSRRAPR